jgi:STAS domain-containing protein
MGGPGLPADDEGRSLTLRAPIARVDVDVLCDRARDLVRGRSDDQLECDVAAVRKPDLATVDALARVELTVRRLGCGIRLRGASVDLLELLAFCGVPLGSVDELERQSEHREEPGGVEEERDPGDPVA